MIVAAFVVSVFALLATAAAALYARAQALAARDQVLAARDQVSAAREQTAAAMAQAAVAERSFELEQKRFDREIALLEEQKTREELKEAKESLVRQRIAFEPPPMPWYVSSAGKNAFLVTNGASRKLYDVSLGFDVEPPRVEPREWARIDERASVRVSMFRSLQASPSSVTVRWKDSPDGKLREWTTDLPS